jgi:hypothetical protein
MMTRIALLAALLTSTTALADSTPALPLECASPEVARANASLLQAQGADFECMDFDECRLTGELVKAAVEQKRAAIAATCPDAKPAPIASGPAIADPWEPDVTPDPAELAWWCEVFGQCTH